MSHEKRFCQRHRCELPIELWQDGYPHAFSGRTLDLSPFGCYASLTPTVPVGITVQIVLWVGSVKLTFGGRIRTNHLNMGNGIEFSEIDDEQCACLKRHLEEINAAPAESFDIVYR
jgi:hypothetical protein